MTWYAWDDCPTGLRSEYSEISSLDRWIIPFRLAHQPERHPVSLQWLARPAIAPEAPCRVFSMAGEFVHLLAQVTFRASGSHAQYCAFFVSRIDRHNANLIPSGAMPDLCSARKPLRCPSVPSTLFASRLVVIA